MQRLSYETKGGIRIEREIVAQPYSQADWTLADRLDARRGVLCFPAAIRAGIWGLSTRRWR